MSWIFATARSKERQGRQNQLLLEGPLYTVTTPYFSIALGGITGTCFFQHDGETETGWAVVGIGIRMTGDHASVLRQDDWAKELSKEVFDATGLDGHFVAIRWRTDTLNCYTDQLGLRTLYFGRDDGRVVLSTRLDWVAQTMACGEIDFHALGSRWLLFNQLSYSSCVPGIDRLGPAGCATIRNGRVVDSRHRSWLPSFEPIDSKTAREALEGILECAFNHPRPASLALSGGLDSRLLLALLALRGEESFVTHSIGEAADPDVSLARQMSAALHITHRQYNNPLPDADRCLSDMQSFAAQSMFTQPITSYEKLRYYSRIGQDCGMMVDGGFGEIARCQYLHRLARLGRAAIEKLDYSRILQLMQAPRSDIFSGEVTTILQKGAFQSLHVALKEMPSVQSLGIENFVALFSVRTRVPNFGGPEQARIDAEIVNLIPLVQPSFLRIVFGIPPKTRRSARFYHDTIRESIPLLGHLALARSGITYPFGLSSTMSWFITKAKSKIGPRYASPGPDALLNHIREYVLDRVHSSDVASDPTYDYRTLLKGVTSYYQGDLACRTTVDWWLAFAFWRSSLSSKPSMATQ